MLFLIFTMRKDIVGEIILFYFLYIQIYARVNWIINPEVIKSKVISNYMLLWKH